MPLDKRELPYVWDMQDAAKEIKSFMRGGKLAKYEKNKVLRYASERQLLVIGEAAHHLTPQFRKQHPEIPWAVFIQFRNILAHEYGESLLTRVWLAATESTPELLDALDELLEEEQKE